MWKRVSSTKTFEALLYYIKSNVMIYLNQIIIVTIDIRTIKQSIDFRYLI